MLDMNGYLTVSVEANDTNAYLPRIRNKEENEYWYIVLPIKETPHIVMRLPHMILRGYALVRLFTSTAVIRRLG